MSGEDPIAWREAWVPIGDLAKELKLSAGKLSRVVRNAELPTKKDPLDQRKVLVQRQVVYELFRRVRPTI
jgi:hypothetical protein